ncbi:undecaprenyldiphospho-muramoylpentapeptide beta-N-acetylglucosaminyltransferase [Petroclostridium sp. X23]|uniref:undecaprenyldiphospho-muramoylpentapeptide beta-N-acetylglucosaminyltransferase n=1 Tax=Petroclostridium sp. X23 TaxID=3045146 RepID=UPI0024AE5947|nr:undecaprenyldiphospho-muramoylpentapeptide beta-N-acetylglucosaminyltransferase [Petroclostridium sp. X23]WHH58892.1 undecaprenyldiphospho-muramoylpentapeptide beta-N-acetylglucosaminyltransferase [Petroclostridium sp. X23]
MKIVFAGGGTAGHINPAIAIAKYIRAKHPDWDILFVGTQEGLEKELVPKEGFDIKFINVRGFRRKLSLDTVVTIKELIRGTMQARKFLTEYKPDIVIGTGGYVCGPVVLNASLSKIPTMIHEQNVIPGVTIKILSRFADIVAISFEETMKYIKIDRKHLIHTGNPIRQEIIDTDKMTARKRLGLSNMPFILAFGGSLGAERINQTLVGFIKRIYKRKSVQLLFGTGEHQYNSVMDELKKADIDLSTNHNIKVVPYIYNMNDVMAAADLVICRAGAITISELTAIGKPCILIPSPNVTHNHQEYNARALEKKNAAVVITEKELNENRLFNLIENLLKDKRLLEKMEKNSSSMGITNATEKIYNSIIEELVHGSQVTGHRNV